MAKILRIVFTILCAICIALVIPVGALWDWTPAIGIGVVALLFFGLMLLCKQAQEAKEANGKGPYSFPDEPSSPTDTQEQPNQTEEK